MITPDELEKKLQVASQRGATPEQIDNKRKEYYNSGMVGKPGLTGLKAFAKTVFSPIETAGRAVGSLAGLGYAGLQGVAGNKSGALDTANYVYKNIMDDRLRKAYSPTGSVAEQSLRSMGEGLKTGAGLSSYIIPGGTTAKSAIGLGALSGALRGGYEEGDLSKTLTNIEAGAIGGGITGGALYGIGKGLQKAGAFTKEKGIGLEQKGTLKQLGTPRKNLGGANLIKEQPAFNIKNTSYDDLLESSTEALNRNSQVIKDTVANTKGIGVDSAVNALKRDLKNKMGEQGSVLTKKYYQDLIDLLDNDLPKGSTLGDFFSTKQVYGAYTKPGFAGGPGDNMQAKAYNYLYGKMSQYFDDIVTKAGYDSLKTANKGVNVALRSLDWADDIARSGKGLPNGIGFQDIVLGSLGYGATGAAAPAVAFAATARAVRNPAVMRAGGKALQGVGNVSQQLGNVAEKALSSPVTRQVLRTGIVAPMLSEKPSEMATPAVPSGTTDATPANNGPITMIEAQGMANPDQAWVIHPSGKWIWNPSRQDWDAFDATTYQKFAGKGTSGGSSGVDGKLNILLDMHNNLPATGFFGGRYTQLAKQFGNSPAAAYEAASSSLAVEIAAAMGLKPLSEAEVAEVRKKWLPAPTDTPEQAAAKVAALKSLISIGGNQGGAE